MRFRSTLIAFLAIVVGGLYVYFVEFKYSDKKKEKEEIAKRIFQISKDKITKVTVDFAGDLKQKTSYILEKKEQEWTISSKEGNFPADKSTVDNLLRSFETVNEQSKFTTDATKTFDKFGLQPASIKTVITEDGGKSTTVSIGLEVTTQSQSYLRVNDSADILLVENPLRYAIDKTVNSFREAKILADISTDQIEKYKAWGKSIPAWEVAKQESGDFAMNLPIEVPVSKLAWAEWSGLFKNLRSSDFEYDGELTPTALKKYNLHSPDYQVQIFGKDQKLLAHLQFGKMLQDPKKPGYFELYVLRVGTKSVRKLGHGQWEKFGKNADDLMTDQPVQFQKNTVSEISVQSGKNTFSLIKDTSKNSWSVKDAAGKIEAAVDSKVDDLLNETLRLKVEKGGWKKKMGEFNLAKPQWSLSLVSGTDKKETFVLSVGDQKSKNRVTAFSQVPKAVFLASTESFNRFKLSPSDYLLAAEEERKKKEEEEKAKLAANKPQPSGEPKMLEPTVANKKDIKKLDKAFVDPAKTYTAKFETNKGNFEVQFFAKDAPYTVSNFLNLARNKFYDGLKFHRVIKDFMAQGGDPDGSGMGGPGYKFQDEFSSKTHERGSLSMANAGPATNGSQFFICFKPQAHLNGKHSVFGQVTGDGMKVVDTLENGDVMKTVTVFEK